MKRLISEYESLNTLVYDPNFGDNKKCKCGHSYYRHFDSHENMEACGCKYCVCDTFEEDLSSNN